MKKILSLLLGGVASLWLVGCSVTSSIYSPCGEKELISPFPAAWLGEWECRSSDREVWSLRLTPVESASGAVHVTMAKLGGPAGAAVRMIPMLGGCFTVDGRKFVTVVADLETMCKESGYVDNSMFLLSPRFYLLTIDDTGAGPVLQFVSFQSIGDREPKAISEKILIQDGLVLNKTEELRAFLAERNYVLDKKRYELHRPAAKKTTNN